MYKPVHARMSGRSVFHAFVIVMFAVFLAGCGGGDGGSSTAGGGSGSGSGGSGSSGGGSTATVPDAPSITSTSVGNGSITVNFDAPASDGGSAITGYTITCVADGNVAFTGTVTASPVTVTGMNGGVTRSCTVTATNSAGTGAASVAALATPLSLSPVDMTRLPVGDNYTTTTTPAVGYLYECMVQSGGGGASVKGPWFNSDGKTWDYTKKVAVQGNVSWPSHQFSASEGSSFLVVSGNDLPDHTTGVYPIAATDPAYQYDRNPNTIQAQNLAWNLPADPTVQSAPHCVSGKVGVLLTGSELFAAVDGENRDAVAWEEQDHCQGHADSSGTYHYHWVSTCAPPDTPGEHSPLVGYAADGFPIYGNLGENGVPLSNADLDECHGHTHAITFNGKTVVMYHYHATPQFPYTVGCFRGNPAMLH